MILHSISRNQRICNHHALAKWNWARWLYNTQLGQHAIHHLINGRQNLWQNLWFLTTISGVENKLSISWDWNRTDTSRYHGIGIVRIRRCFHFSSSWRRISSPYLYTYAGQVCWELGYPQKCFGVNICRVLQTVLDYMYYHSFWINTSCGRKWRFAAQKSYIAPGGDGQIYGNVECYTYRHQIIHVWPQLINFALLSFLYLFITRVSR